MSVLTHILLRALVVIIFFWLIILAKALILYHKHVKHPIYKSFSQYYFSRVGTFEEIVFTCTMVAIGLFLGCFIFGSVNYYVIMNTRYSIIGTDPTQSKLLLAAGFGKETADLSWVSSYRYNHLTERFDRLPADNLVFKDAEHEGDPSWINLEDFPSWSLGRMIELTPEHVVWRILRLHGNNVSAFLSDLVLYHINKKDVDTEENSSEE